MMTKYTTSIFHTTTFRSHSGHTVLLSAHVVYKIQQIVSFFLFLFILMGILMGDNTPKIFYQ